MFKPMQDVVSRKKENMLILLRTSTGHYYTLNETGSLLWENLIEKQLPLDKCISVIVAGYEDSPDPGEIRTDCDALIKEWKSEQLIEEQA